MTPEELEQQLLSNAKTGDVKAAKEALKLFLVSADRSTPLSAYIAACIEQYVTEGITLDRAFNLQRVAKRGPKKQYVSLDLVSADILLERYLEMNASQRDWWIEEHLGPRRTTIQKYRKQYKQFYAYGPGQRQATDLNGWLALAGDHRQSLATVLQQIGLELLLWLYCGLSVRQRDRWMHHALGLNSDLVRALRLQHPQIYENDLLTTERRERFPVALLMNFCPPTNDDQLKQLANELLKSLFPTDTDDEDPGLQGSQPNSTTQASNEFRKQHQDIFLNLGAIERHADYPGLVAIASS